MIIITSIKNLPSNIIGTSTVNEHSFSKLARRKYPGIELTWGLKIYTIYNTKVKLFFSVAIKFPRIGSTNYANLMRLIWQNQ